MAYTSSTRDRYRFAVRTTTALVAAGAVTATGWVAGAAARQQDRADAAEQARQQAQAQREHDAWVAAYGDRAAARRTQPVLRQRPTRTRVTTRYVTAAGTAPVGGGGTVSTPTTTSTTTSAPSGGTGGSTGGSSGSTGGGSTGTTGQQAPPPPPPPPPPPAPSSGS